MSDDLDDSDDSEDSEDSDAGPPHVPLHDDIAIPTLPVKACDVLKITYEFYKPQPTSLSSSDIQAVLEKAPTLGRRADQIELECSRLYGCNGVQMCLMAVDSNTGDGILHAVIDAPNLKWLYVVAALVALPWVCGNAR
ncbi:hypothetical protein ACHAQH_002189 [Verticillium albo-atrum]